MSTSGSPRSRRTESNARATEPASATSHSYARESGNSPASFEMKPVPRASRATLYASDPNLRANAAPFPGPTPATTQVGFAMVRNSFRPEMMPRRVERSDGGVLNAPRTGFPRSPNEALENRGDGRRGGSSRPAAGAGPGSRGQEAEGRHDLLRHQRREGQRRRLRRPRRRGRVLQRACEDRRLEAHELARLSQHHGARRRGGRQRARPHRQGPLEELQRRRGGEERRRSALGQEQDQQADRADGEGRAGERPRR